MDRPAIDQGPARLRGHSIQIDARERMTVTGVNDVECFNDQEIELVTDVGALRVEGEGLHMTGLSLEDGLVTIEGLVIAIEYGDDPAERGSLISRLFR